MKSEHPFSLLRVTLLADGGLDVEGFVPESQRRFRWRSPKCQVGIAARSGAGLTWVDAHVESRGPEGVNIKASFTKPGTLPPTELGDLYFRRLGGTDEAPYKMKINSVPTPWRAYPTKFMNLSFKRVSK